MMPVNPIIAAAVADVVLGMVMYSEYAFGPMWAKVSGEKCSGKDMPMRLAAQFVSSLMVAAAMYIAIVTFKKTEMTALNDMFTRMYGWFLQDGNMAQADMMSAMKIAGFLWLGFLVPHVICEIVWENHINWKKGVMKAAFILVHFLVIASVLAYF
jgi:hypothetical protein